MSESITGEARERFDKWCPIKITNPAKAIRATELVASYWTAWQAAAVEYEPLRECLREFIKLTCDVDDDAPKRFQIRDALVERAKKLLEEG